MYNWKESRIGLGRAFARPMKTVPGEMTMNATSRMIALVDGAVRQTRHTGLPGEDESSSTAACASGLRKPQK